MKIIKVTLLHHTPLHISANGARTCWDSFDKSDTPKCLSGSGKDVYGDGRDIRCNVCGHHFCICEEPVIGSKDLALLEP